jgi:hypothetical protein
MKVKDLKENTIYYDIEHNELFIVEALAPTSGDEGIFLLFLTKQGHRFSCVYPESSYTNFIEIGEL